MTTMKGTFFFDPEDAIYKDHFPGNPVVPGSLVVHAFLKALKTHTGTAASGMVNFRFKTFLHPGTYSYRISRSPKGTDCFIYAGNRTLVTGTLLP